LPHISANCLKILIGLVLMQIVIKMKDGECPSPKAMAKQVLCYLEENGYLQA
jgi:hypothetical protein